jgi:uncharacterized membrane protein
VAALAGRQAGRVSRRQLRLLGCGRGLIAGWLASQYLIEELPRVYAVGHAARSIDANLTAALLYAGPGAMLAGTTAGWWVGAVRDQPRDITVSTPRRSKPLPVPWGGRIVVHSRRPPERIWLPRNGKAYGPAKRTALRLPLSPPEQLALDLAAVLGDRDLRHALADLEYRQILDVGDLRTACQAGRRGSTRLRAAIAAHSPLHARTNSPWEDGLLLLCERHAIPPPDETDTHIAGIEADAVWHDAKLIVEIDGRDNHRTWAQITRDRRHELTLRGLGYTILRYTREQLAGEPARVAGEIGSYVLNRPERSAG